MYIETFMRFFSMEEWLSINQINNHTNENFKVSNEEGNKENKGSLAKSYKCLVPGRDTFISRHMMTPTLADLYSPDLGQLP